MLSYGKVICMKKLVLTMLSALILNSCGSFKKKDDNSGEGERDRIALSVEDMAFIAPILEFEANKIYGRVPLVKDSERKEVRDCVVVSGDLPNGFHLSDQCEIYGIYRESEDFTASDVLITFSTNTNDYLYFVTLSVIHKVLYNEEV